MQTSRPKKLVLKRPCRPPSAPAARGVDFLDGGILGRDEDLGSSRTTSSRSDFETYFLGVRRKQLKMKVPRTHLFDDLRRDRPLVCAILEDLAVRFALDEKEAYDLLDNFSYHIPWAHVLLQRVEELCASAHKMRPKLGAESVCLPFEVWLKLSADAHAASGNYHAAPYRGLVLQDYPELALISDYNESFTAQSMTPFLVVLDLSHCAFYDVDAVRLKLSVGRTLGALRLDDTEITNAGIANLARSLSDGCNSFANLQYLSLQRLGGVTDKAMSHMARFPSLAALDLRGTNCTGIEFLRRAMLEVGGQHYHVATELERSTFASHLALSTVYRRLRTLIERAPESAETRPLPSLVHIREIQRQDTYAWETAKPYLSRGHHTTSLGQVFSTSAIDAHVLQEDNEEAQAGHAAFRIGSGGLWLNSTGYSEVRRCAAALADELSDSDEVQSTRPVNAGRAAMAAFRTEKEAKTPTSHPLLLFRCVRVGEAVDTKALSPLLTIAAKPKANSLRPSLETCLPRKRPALRERTAAEGLLGISDVGPGRPPLASSLSRPSEAPSLWTARSSPSVQSSSATAGSKRSRTSLSSFKRSFNQVW